MRYIRLMHPYPTAFSRVLVAIAACILFVPAHARQELHVDLRSTVPPGSEEGPALLITPRKDVSWMKLTLTRTGADGETKKVTLNPGLTTNRQNEVPLPHPKGSFSWEGTLSVGFSDGTEGAMPLSFQTSRLAEMRIESDATRDDIMARRVVIRADRDIDRAVVRVTGEGGRDLGRTNLNLDGAKAGSELVVEWDQDVDGDPLIVEVTLHDVHGSNAGIQWMPWEVRIDHETVEFDTGESRVREDQTHKLEAVLGKLNDALQRYGAVVDVSLWIAGHTDTVGSREMNRRLSEARARAIATWFRRSGVTVPIHYRGFGQDSLLIDTPDNVDEPRNRRADYVVAAEDPYADRDLPGRWQRLP